MYKPPERIPYESDFGRLPSREEVAASRLFAPLRAGRLELAERSWVPAMVPWRATPDGAVNDNVLDWYARFARGQPGGLVVEATGIRDIPSGPLLRIGDDRFLPGLEALTQTVQRESGGRTRLFIQLIDFLTIKRRPPPEKFFDRYLEITEAHRERLGMPEQAESEVRERLKSLSEDDWREVLDEREQDSLFKGYRERVTDTHLEHIRELPEVLPGLFAEAARRAERAGFDGVELHYAHAYTMASFLSALNTREDGYGGPRENRVRLPLEVFHAVREAVSADFAVGARFLTDDCVAGGSRVDDAEYFAAQFAEAGMDFLSTSRGGKFEDAATPKIGSAIYPYTGLSGYECMPQFLSDERGPFGRNVDETARVRRAVREAGYQTPVVVTGGIHGFDQAEGILRQEKADIIGAARQSLADPDWYKKIRLGHPEDVRVCTFTNYCEGLDQKHKQVTCKLWDRVALDEPEAPMSEDGKRRLVAPDWAPPDE